MRLEDQTNPPPEARHEAQTSKPTVFPQAFFSAAVSFLTILPVHRAAVPTDRALAGSRHWYPVVGLLLGGVVALAAWVLGQVGRPNGTLTAFGTVLVWIGLTGALHLDGLADCFDGLPAAGGPARRLAILRDPHVGSFGVLALVLVVLGKVLSLAALAGPARLRAIVLAITAGRCAMLTVAGAGPYARPSGTGRFFIDATTPREGALAAGVSVVLGLALCGAAGLVAAVAGVGVSYGWARLCRIRLGGLTGDCLGAAGELVELVILAVLAGMC